MTIEEKAYWHWFLSIPISYIGQKKLLDALKTPQKVWDASEKQMIEIIGKTRQSIEYMRTSRHRDWEKEYLELEKNGICLTMKEEEEYPVTLLPLPDAPYGLYHIGKLPEDEICVGIVGARDCSRYGRETAAVLGRTLGEMGISVISGMARGIDGAGQWAALAGGGKSYAVMGCGVDICYPQENEELYERLKQHGTIISEFPPGTQPISWHFPIRNRIISGLSHVLIVVEARERSGSLITADLALEQGKEVYAVPGRITDRLSFGCNELIYHGAGILLSPQMLLRELGVDLRKKENNSKKNGIALAEKENLLYSGLDLTPKSTETISKETGLSVAEIMEHMVSLQLKGLVVEVGTGFYALTGTELWITDKRGCR